MYANLLSGLTTSERVYFMSTKSASLGRPFGRDGRQRVAGLGCVDALESQGRFFRNYADAVDNHDLLR